ncbi:MAG: IgGFc-binding protein [Deltaproteobacteria bacterium]|nr:IgGFc-binding protein [Deltaproteobacteria bacterium]
MHVKYLLAVATVVVVTWIGCSATETTEFDPPSSTSTGTSSGTGGLGFGGSGGIGFGGGIGQGGACSGQCSADLHQVLDCNGVVIQECTGLEGCDMETLTCINACQAANNNKQSVGCQYWATDMEAYQPTYCFAAFVANTWNTPAHLTVEHDGNTLPVASFARIPQGQGPSLTYQPYDNTAGLPAGEVAILFLSGNSGGAPNCPVTSGVPGAGMSGTGVSASFRIESDVPVVAYQINPYGGGSVAVTGASLLLPTSAWDTNYIAVNAYQQDIAPPSLNIVATEDNTAVTMVPVAAVTGGGGIPSSPANTPFTFTLHRGQNAQITQAAELTGSVIQSDKPIGFMAGQPCMRTPFGVAYCDHGEQMVPPVQALGSEYVGVMYRRRQGEPAIWRLIGAQDGTQLTWTPDVGGPATLEQGQIVEVITGTPFVVSAQDDDHPFLLFTHMAGSQWSQLSDNGGYGDVDFVISVPPNQYMSAYVFFADPTYPETNLVVVRSPDDDGNFHDVDLDCAGLLGGWQPVGDYEWTRIDLITGDFQNVGNCSTGRHEMSSDGRFGLWVWGWGTPLTSTFTQNVSYGYPAGMNVQPINTVVIPPVPR